MRAAFGTERDGINLDVVITLSNDLAIKVGDKTLISSDVECHRSVAVEVEEGLEGDKPTDRRSISLIVPDPESARS